MEIVIDCTGGGGGGGCGCGGTTGSPGGGFPSGTPGGGTPGNTTGGGTSGGSPSGGNTTGNTPHWWNYGTGWPWYGGGGGNNPLDWNWWWTSGGGSGSGSGGFLNLTVITLTSQLGLSSEQSIWLENNPEFATLLYDQLLEYGNSEEAKTASKILLDLEINNLLQYAWGNDFGNAAIPHLQNHFSCCTMLWINPNFALNWGLQTHADYLVIRQENPSWSKLRCAWEAIQETVHTGLDMAGLIPVIGEVFDITSGIIYTVQGDGLNATLAYSSAVPFAGMEVTAVKYFKKTITGVNGTTRTVKFIKLTNGKIGFSKNSKKFRESLGLLPGDLRQAHHIIPWGNDIPMLDAIQKAAKSSHSFHIDDALNGIPVEAWRNYPNHPDFNNLIKAKLNSIPSNLSNDATYNAVMNIINQAKQAILNNPNVHINNITF
ncbi:MAG: hypothetical protein EAZ47_03495 [Bacteroidetes bacterium]|nr:MAG: hypothetical protein EAY72_13970 [Bacteroidota bacterium]TAF95117.1 MAG: hypothetical protein EAZ47_03495 [Bacteroidota bacterium]